MARYGIVGEDFKDEGCMQISLPGVFGSPHEIPIGRRWDMATGTRAVSDAARRQ